MADPQELYPTKTRLALLADVAALKVADDSDGTVWLDCGDGERAKVSATVWEMARAGWVSQRENERGWRITELGSDVLEAGQT